MTIADLKTQKLLVFECISGSRAYGTDLPGSDTDIKGVFVLPKASFYGLDSVEQVSSEKNDEVYYELKRFGELLYKNNPGILEMLASPADCILFCHPLFEPFLKVSFLSQLCKETFAGFAFAQIKKARGLNKKINVPMPPARKSPLDFCFVAEKQGSVSLMQWLNEKGWKQENCGLVAIPNMRDVYGLYYDTTGQYGFSGVVKKDAANDVALSSVPKDMPREALMSFNKDAYSMHCRDYREYQAWQENRNEERCKNTLAHGKNYDAKNMMHTIRLLETAAEILETGVLNVRRPNRDILLEIRRGAFEYDTLMATADEKLQQIEQLHATTRLPVLPDKSTIEQMLTSIRDGFYSLQV